MQRIKFIIQGFIGGVFIGTAVIFIGLLFSPILIGIPVVFIGIGILIGGPISGFFMKEYECPVCQYMVAVNTANRKHVVKCGDCKTKLVLRGNRLVKLKK